MNSAAVRKALRKFARDNEVKLTTHVRRESQLLELAAMMLAVTHYERQGYSVEAVNLSDDQFKVNLNSRGYPWNFSAWRVERRGDVFFIYGNLAVESACQTDGGIYVVDVAVVSGEIEQPKRNSDWLCLPNDQLVTFLEAKRIVVYPMLLAQFVGIVHEIKPRFLNGRRPRNFLQLGHFDPALISIGYVHGRSRPIVRGYDDRRFKITIVGHADTSIAQAAHDPDRRSPLDQGARRETSYP